MSLLADEPRLERHLILRTCSRASALVGAAALLPLLLSGCLAIPDQAPQRPDPTAVVHDYLTAIAEGDAETAMGLDSDAVEAETENRAISEDGDLHTLRTNAVLQAAGRIENVAIEEKTRAVDDDEDTRRVDFTYDLGGETHEYSLNVRWDDKDMEWELEDSLTQDLSVYAEKSIVVQEMPPFRIAGRSQVLATDSSTAPVDYLVYPGVYEIAAAFPIEYLAAGVGSVQTIIVDTSSHARVSFEVVTMPSGCERGVCG